MIRRFPSIRQCLEFFDQYAMLDNIRAHSFVVGRVAEALIDGLHSAGKAQLPLPNRQEVIVGALFHDIAKSLCLKNNCLHAETGREICIELGYPELGKIVAEHVALENYTPELHAQGFFTAKELVFYADKRVRHDRIVSLSTRLDYIIKRYANANPAQENHIRLNFARAFELEKHLFMALDFSPDEVIEHVSLEPFRQENGHPA